ncbi:replication factor C [Trametes maxima]|nr:replication factor C [Trametes maxima]
MTDFFRPQQFATAQKPAVDPQHQPWVEKYRPKTIDDVSAQEHTVAVLRKTLTSSNLPHMLFYGPPGTGKTSTILALARQLFGPDNFRSRVLELNASDERGISIAVASDGKTYPCPPYKIIILDEADSMTQDAQAALRRIMELYARITRFCLVCNYVTRIIEPLASRCSKFRFKPLDPGSTSTRLAQIASAENVPVSPATVDALIATSQGDLRRAITYLQSASRLALASTPPTEITPRDVQEIAGVVPDAVVVSFAAALGVERIGGDGGDGMDVDVDLDVEGRTRAPGFDGVRRKVRQIIREGYSASQIISQLHDYVISHPTLSARQKARSALVFAEADKALCDGADEELWILEVGLRIHRAMSSS